MKRRVLVFSLLAFFALGAVAVAAAKFNEVKPQEFDPAKTELVQAAWVNGIGCPNNAPIADYPSNSATRTYSDPACSDPADVADKKDKRNMGLLLAKTGPTSNNASAYVELKNLKGQDVTELGYDLRKPGVDPTDPRGSHCGGGAPRFIVVTSGGTDSSLGCNSVHLDRVTPGDGWMRLRWTVNYTDVQAIYILSDEGQDASGGPDQFGLSVLDNIDVNGTLVGQGPKDAD